MLREIKLQVRFPRRPVRLESMLDAGVLTKNGRIPHNSVKRLCNDQTRRTTKRDQIPFCETDDIGCFAQGWKRACASGNIWPARSHRVPVGSSINRLTERCLTPLTPRSLFLRSCACRPFICAISATAAE